MKTSLIIIIFFLLTSKIYPQDSQYSLEVKLEELENDAEKLKNQLREYKDFNFDLDRIEKVYSNIDTAKLKKIINSNSIGINLPSIDVFTEYSYQDLELLKRELNSLLEDNKLIEYDTFSLDEEKTEENITNSEKLKRLEEKLKVITSGLPTIKEKLVIIKGSLDNLIKSNKEQIQEISKKLEKKKRDINTIAVTWGLPLFCVTILLLFLFPAYLNQRKNNKNQINQQYLLDVSTVLLLTLSILILGLSDKIDSAVLGTLLGGISGYVLNRTIKRKENNENTTVEQKNVNPQE